MGFLVKQRIGINEQRLLTLADLKMNNYKSRCSEFIPICLLAKYSSIITHVHGVQWYSTTMMRRVYALSVQSIEPYFSRYKGMILSRN